MEFLNTEIITEILAKEEEISKISIHDWQVNNKVIPVGNNYSSEITRLTVHYQKSGKSFSKMFIFKLPSHSSMYELGLQMHLYQKECIMYTQILPELHRFNQNIAPLYFYTGRNHSLILEDLSQSGYTLARRKDQLDFEHCRLVFRRLATFHAFSVYLNKLNKIPDYIKELNVCENTMDLRKLFQSMQNSYAQFMGRLEEPYKTKYLAKLKRIQSTLIEDYMNLVQPKQNGFNCLNHGDFWLANMMFKYDQFGLVEHVKFIDFQCCNWTSPVIDIIRFTISSMRFEVYEKYFELLLDTYLEALNMVLVHFECEPYEKKDLKTDIEEKFIYTISTIFDTLPSVLADFGDDESIDLDKVIMEGETSMKFAEKVAGDSYATKVVMKWFKHFAERGLSSSPSE